MSMGISIINQRYPPSSIQWIARENKTTWYNMYPPVIFVFFFAWKIAKRGFSLDIKNTDLNSYFKLQEFILVTSIPEKKTDQFHV